MSLFLLVPRRKERSGQRINAAGTC